MMEQSDLDQNKTIFCDIDGVLFRFESDFAISMNHARPLPGSAERTMHWHKKGYRIILVTGRPEAFRERTQKQLQRLGFIYDQLVMGCGSGPRHLINDVESYSEQKAYAHNVIRNKGLASLATGEWGSSL
tara:strand:- start:1695 stop:2084 length:390 start_codon:yes stop_codon:yes gene_type:complete